MGFVASIMIQINTFMSIVVDILIILTILAVESLAFFFNPMLSFGPVDSKGLSSVVVITLQCWYPTAAASRSE